MKPIIKILNLVLLFGLFSACSTNQIEFDQSKWNENIDGFYAFREIMVKDLMENHVEKGMTYKQLTDLIGIPDNLGNLKANTIGYTIMEDYSWDIDPVETKTLLIELTTDSLVQNFKVEHWKK